MFTVDIPNLVRPRILLLRLSVCLSVCLKPKFVRLKPKFDEDAEEGPPSEPEKLNSAPRSTSSIDRKRRTWGRT